MSWAEMNFIDFIQLQRGHDLTKEHFVNGIYPVVSSTTIMGYHNECKAQGPGVIIGRSGTLGVVQYIESNYWPHNTSLYVKDFKNNVPKFVYYFMMNFGTDTHGGGSAVPTLNRNSLSKIKVKIPDTITQHRIAETLSFYDNLIDNNFKQIKLFEEAAMRLYKEWFLKFRFPGYENVRIIDGVPDGWERKSINDIMTFQRGYDLTKTNMRGGLYPVVGSTSIIGFHDEYKTKGPGIVTGRSGSLGTYQLIWDDFWPHNTSLYISDYKGHNIFFLYCLLQTVDFSLLNNGGAIPTLNRNTLSNIIVIEPCKDLQEEFATIARSFYERILKANIQIKLLRQARDKLLPGLMSGDIVV